MNREIYLDPSDERTVAERAPAARSRAIENSVVALVDIGKTRGDRFLDALEQLIRRRYAAARIVRYRKPTFARPAPEDLRRKIAAECALVIEALAD